MIVETVKWNYSAADVCRVERALRVFEERCADKKFLAEIGNLHVLGYNVSRYPSLRGRARSTSISLSLFGCQLRIHPIAHLLQNPAKTAVS